MKPLLRVVTHENNDVLTMSTFTTLFVTAKKGEKPEILVNFTEEKNDDGTWERDFPMYVRTNMMVPVLHLVDGVPVPLLRDVVTIITPEPLPAERAPYPEEWQPGDDEPPMLAPVTPPPYESITQEAVIVDEFTLMRFLCWDNALVPLRDVVTSSIFRIKKKQADIAAGIEPEPYTFTLPPPIPKEMFLEYLDTVLS